MTTVVVEHSGKMLNDDKCVFFDTVVFIENITLDLIFILYL